MKEDAKGKIGRIAVILASGLLVLAACVAITTLPYGRAINDLLVLLDGSYRMSLGQIPHVDFASPIGPLLLFATHWGQILFPTGNAFVTYHAMIWLFFLPVFLMLAGRFPSNWQFLAAFCLFALMVLLPMTLDDTHLSEISYFASYNRFASGLLFCLGLWYVLPRRRFDALLLTYLLLLLIFVKITAAIVGGGIILCALILRRVGWKTVIGTVVLTALALVGLNMPDGLVSGYMRDIGTMIAINEDSGLYALFYYGFTNWLVLGLCGLIALRVLMEMNRQTPVRAIGLIGFVRRFLDNERFVVDLLLLVVAVWGAESQNTGGLGLIAAAAILFHPDAWSQRQRVLVACLTAALIFPVLDMAMKRGLRGMMRDRVSAPEQPLQPLFAGVRVPMSTYQGAKLFSHIMHDELDLALTLDENRYFLIHDPTSNAPAVNLAIFMDVIDAARAFDAKGYRSKAQNFTTLMFADPFGSLLGLTPAKGTMLTMDVGRTVPQFTQEEAAAYLAKSDGVFARHCELTSPQMASYFKTVLADEFDSFSLNACWSFYARKGGGENGALSE